MMQKMKKDMNKNKPLTVEIKDDQLIISVGIDTIAFAAENNTNENYKVLNNKKFAEAVAQTIDAKLCGDDYSYIERALDRTIDQVYMNGSPFITNARPYEKFTI